MLGKSWWGPSWHRMASTLGKRLVACLLNVSEARRKDLVVKIAQAAITNNNGEFQTVLKSWTESVHSTLALCPILSLCFLSGGWRVGTTVLNIFNDFDYNRSVITIVASIDHISECWTVYDTLKNQNTHKPMKKFNNEYVVVYTIWSLEAHVRQCMMYKLLCCTS